jgi:hypothetical protein
VRVPVANVPWKSMTPNHALQTTRAERSGSASRLTVCSPACLSFLR